MSKLITPLELTKLDDRLLLTDGAQDNDACNAVANILKDHQTYLKGIRQVYPDDPVIVTTWPSLAVEWVTTSYTRMGLGTACNYKCDVNLNIWYYRDEVKSGYNNREVRTMCSIIGKIIMSHRRINGLCTAEEAHVINSEHQTRPRDNNSFDAGVVNINVPVRVCQTDDPSRGGTLNT